MHLQSFGDKAPHMQPDEDDGPTLTMIWAMALGALFLIGAIVAGGLALTLWVIGRVWL